MHIDTNNLVGTIVSQVLANNGAITFVLNDIDSTPSREFKTTKYVQTKELTSIGVAVKEYGTIIVPKEVIDNTAIDKTAYAIIVNWGGALYAIALNTFLALEEGNAVTFAPYVEGTYKGQIMGETFPPFNVTQKGKVAAVNATGTGLEWKENDNEIPSVSGNANKVLTVKTDASGIEWKAVPKEIPTVAGHTGQYLNVANDGVNVQWKAVNEVPTVNNIPNGYLVTRTSNGYEWKEPTGAVPTPIPFPGTENNLVLTSGETGDSYYWGTVPVYLHIFAIPETVSGDANIKGGKATIIFLSSSSVACGGLSEYLLNTVGNDTFYRFAFGIISLNGGSSNKTFCGISYKRQGGVWKISSSDSTDYSSSTANLDALEPNIIPIIQSYIPET